jgi:hypothetical protein
MSTTTQAVSANGTSDLNMVLVQQAIAQSRSPGIASIPPDGPPVMVTSNWWPPGWLVLLNAGNYGGNTAQPAIETVLQMESTGHQVDTYL